MINKLLDYLAAFFVSFLYMYLIASLGMFFVHLIDEIVVGLLTQGFNLKNSLIDFYRSLRVIAIPSAFMGFVGMYEYWKSSQTQYPYTKRRKFKDIEDESWDVDVDD